MRKLRQISKKYYFRQIISCWMMFAMLLALTPARIAMANPNPLPNTVPTGLGGHSGAEITNQTLNTMEITQTANRAIMNWDNFDIGSNSSVQFFQPGTTSAVLNRVHDGVGTGIMGSLSANGRVFIINPAGILFGKGAKINVTQLTASSLDLADDDFLDGAPYTFINGRTAGDVIFNANASDVTAERLFLIGKNVRNYGGLVAKDFVVMAAGDSVLISEPDSSVAVQVDMGGMDPAQFKIENVDLNPFDPCPTSVEAKHIILAAGDIWSAALVKAYSNGGSDAVATVDIAGSGNVLITNDVTAEAVGDGVSSGFNASAAVNISAGGDLTIQSGVFGQETELSAKATNGTNNNADVTLQANGAFTINAPDQVTIQAEAGSAGALNQANVNITADSVLITATDLGLTDEPATVEAYAHDATVNRAGVDIQSTGDVDIIGAGSNGDSAIVEALAQYGSENYANVTINAGGDVDIIAETGVPTCGDQTTQALVLAKATDADVLNDASVNINAGGDVLVKSEGGNEKVWFVDEGYDCWEIVVPGHWEGFGFGKHWVPPIWGYVHHCIWVEHSSFTPYVASVEAIAENAGSSNTANVDITAGDGVKVIAEDGGIANILAEAEYGQGNTSGVTINSDGDVKVLAIGGACSTEDGFTESEASIKSKAENGLENTADIGINAVGGDVLVLGTEGGDAAITALAKNAQSPTTNTANVTINATEEDIIEIVEGVPTIVGTEGGDVKVIADKGGEAEIEALALEGGQTSNNAGVLICADGDVKVKGDRGGEAEIEALAKYGITNTATVGICAKGEEGVEVLADRGGEAKISSEAKDGDTDTASTIVHADGGDILVKATRGGDAGILAEAENGIFTDAYVGVCATGDIVVQTGEIQPDVVEGCDAVIKAEADMGMIQLVVPGPGETPVIPTANARTVAYSHQGNVEVLAFNHGHSGIEAEAEDAHLNTASVGIAAGADLSPADAAAASTGNVVVVAQNDSKAQILAYAHDATPIYEYPAESLVLTADVITEPATAIPGENTAQTVICAPGQVSVFADESSEARIKSFAKGYNGTTNSATTEVYSEGLNVLGPGAVVGAATKGDSGFQYDCITESGRVALTDGSAVLIIDSYANKKDCPTCPPCPCEKASPAVLPVAAPLPVYYIPRIAGCPELTLSAADELGVPAETLQIGMGNALALNPNLQPCQACASLLHAAHILQDKDGSRMAAMLQIFNSTAPANAPYTPEMGTSIAMAFENAAGGSQYASAKEFIDAFVQYAAALDAMGSPVGDSTAFVMGKYGQGLSQNGNMASFVAERVAGGQTF